MNVLAAKNQKWLLPTDLQADAFKGMRTTQNALSVFELEDDKETTVDRVLAAIAATREHVPNLDYILLPRGVFDGLGLEIRRTSADTPDTEVNAWHVDVGSLNSTRLIQLCDALRNHGRVLRKLPKQVARLLDQGMQAGRLDRALMDAKLLESIKRHA